VKPKDNTGKEAWNKDGLMQEAIRAIKAVCQNDCYARCRFRPILFGHDGIIENGDVETMLQMMLSKDGRFTCSWSRFCCPI
jgi:delta-aminolevulinic acid dehydratase/porphobilinogen synthase